MRHSSKENKVTKANQRHVVHHPEGGWAVRKPHSAHASSRHSTQELAQTRAKEILSHSGGGEAVTHRPDGTIRESATIAPGTVDWSLLSAQGHVLFYIALCPGSTVKEIARAVGRTERQIWSIIHTLKRSGMLRLRKKGLRHYYRVDLDAPLLHPTIEGLILRPVMEPVIKQMRANEPDFCQEKETFG
ncbi:MAG TPA: DUF2188 domain-containing protein [Dehalococcoidia bacterium]|nr:DUF2188 domain-containing protein [Dehalococcoidia bacterium]